LFSSRRRHTRSTRDWSSDVCSSDLERPSAAGRRIGRMSPPQAPEPVIDVQDLWKSFAGFGVLKGINLKMMEGTTTVVLGGSGSRSEERRVGKGGRARRGRDVIDRK